MKKCVIILLILSFLITLCSCNKANSDKYKPLIESLENKDVTKAYENFSTITYQAKSEAQEKEIKKYKKKVTEVTITKDNILDYFEIVNLEDVHYNEFNEAKRVCIQTVFRLKEGFTIADSMKCRTDIDVSFTAWEVSKLYFWNPKTELFILKDDAPDTEKENHTFSRTIYNSTTELATPLQHGDTNYGPYLNVYEDVKVTSANGTLYLFNGKDDSESKGKYEMLIEALKSNDIYTAQNEFFELTKNARKNIALKEQEEYKKNVTKIEINSMNIWDYFEFVNCEDFVYNDFNEVETITVKTFFRLKKEFKIADTEKCNTNIFLSAGVTETTRIFHFEPKSETFVLKGYAPNSVMNVHLREFETYITNDNTEVFVPYGVDLDWDRDYIQLGENGRIFDASGTLYLLK